MDVKREVAIYHLLTIFELSWFTENTSAVLLLQLKEFSSDSYRSGILMPSLYEIFWCISRLLWKLISSAPDSGLNFRQTWPNIYHSSLRICCCDANYFIETRRIRFANFEKNSNYVGLKLYVLPDLFLWRLHSSVNLRY